MKKNILLALDFGLEPTEIITTGVEYAAALQAKLWLLHVVSQDPDYVGYSAGPQNIRDQRAEEIKQEWQAMDQYVQEIQSKGVDASGLMIQGATVDMIIQKAKQLSTDLIILGHEDKSLLFRALRGSVSSEVLKQSEIPVLIVPIKRSALPKS